MKRVFLMVLLAIFLTVGVTQAWSVRLLVIHNNKTIDIFTFGVKKNATDKFDVKFDVPIPPAPPNATFDAYFVSRDPLFKRLKVDYRNYMLWRFVVRTKYPIILKWDKPPVPLHMTVNGKLFVDMVKERSLSLNKGRYTIVISGYRNETIPFIATPAQHKKVVTTPTATTKSPGFEVVILIFAALFVLVFAIKK